MAITRIQKKDNSASTASTVTVTLDSAPTSGNLLVATTAFRSDSAPGTAPDGTWTLAEAIAPGTPSSVRSEINIWYKISDGTETVTIWTLDSTGYIGACVREYAGANVLDVTADAGAHSTATTHSTGTTAATSVNDSVAVAAVGINANDPTVSWTNSFTELAGNRTGAATASYHSADKILTATGTQESTCASVSAHGAACIATFSAAITTEGVVVLTDEPTTGVTLSDE